MPKNLLNEELHRHCQELEANKDTLLLVEKLEIELKEIVAANHNLENLALLAQEIAIVE